MAAPPRKLTEKQRRFVEAYMGEANGNATEAARIAGYSGKRHTLESMGSENLRKPEIIAALNERLDSDPGVASREERLQKLTEILRCLPDEKRGYADQLRAIEILCKLAGDFVDRSEVKHKVERTEEQKTEDLLRSLPDMVAILQGAYQ